MCDVKLTDRFTCNELMQRDDIVTLLQQNSLR